MEGISRTRQFTATVSFTHEGPLGQPVRVSEYAAVRALREALARVPALREALVLSLREERSERGPRRPAEVL